MAGAHPEQHVRVPWLYQRWESLTFLHWAFDPPAVQRLLPRGLVVDTFEGRAWVGLTPFLMRRLRPPLLPTLGPLSTYPEINLRTYVRGPDGRDGLWFLSLDTARVLNMLAGTLGLHYAWSGMRVARAENSVAYTARRRLPAASPAPRVDVQIDLGEPLPTAQVDERTHFLTGRWRAYHAVASRLLVTPVEHPPWPLRQATVRDFSEQFVHAAGLPSPTEPPLVHFSDGVDVRVGYPRPADSR
jgi:uncharacterized protein YqjF (DUF2071 family)